MTDSTKLYPKSIAAAQAIDGGLWAFALALAEETNATGHDAAKVTKVLAKAGVTSTSGEPYSTNWIRSLIQVGRFALPGKREAFTKYPVKRVLAAALKAKWDAEEMLLLLNAEGATRHTIAGTSLLGKVTKQKVKSEIDRLTPEDKAALAGEILEDEEVIEALKEDDTAHEQVLEATVKASTYGKGRPHKAPKGGISQTLNQMLTVMDLQEVCEKFLEQAKETPDAPLVAQCRAILKRTLEIADAIAEASDSGVVDQMFDDLGDLLASQ